MIVVAEMRREARQDIEGAKLRGDGSTTIWPQATFVSHARGRINGQWSYGSSQCMLL